MITNERQYRITNSQLAKLREAAESFSVKEVADRLNSGALAKAELAALQSEIENLAQQVQEYETLRSGSVDALQASSLAGLPRILIKARIARGLSQKELAEAIGVKEQQVQRYEAEEYASASLRRLADIANALDINVRELAEFRPTSEPLPNTDAVEFAWDQFPVKEMYLHNWFEGFSGSLSEAIANAEELVREFVTDSLDMPVRAAARQRVRAGGTVNRYALLAWQCRVIALASKRRPQIEYRHGVITRDWLASLVQLSCDSNGPKEAVQRLESAGIRVIIEPHLSQTHLDGAAFLLPGATPIIGLTLRYDRLDNFWFVLVHEVVHVMKHLHKGSVESIFDDLDTEAGGIEQEADEEAGEILVPSDKWETALARYLRTRDSIEGFAAEIGVHPAIVAGKIRRESNNYAILTDMVGQGEVRSLF